MKEKQIVDAARKLFYKFGFKKVSMDEIAREAGVTKKTVYTYFSSKEELFKYFIQEELDNMKKIVEDIEKEDLDFFEAVHQIIFQLIKYKNKRQFFKLMTNEAEVLKSSIASKSLNLIDEQIQSYIYDIVKNAMDKGYIKKENPEVVTFLVYKMYIALMFDWSETREKLDEEEIAKTILDILKNGLGEREINEEKE
jgi:TetR/AcrR family transcriptional regulator